MQSTEREDKGARQLLLSLWFVCHRSSRVTPPSTRSTQVPGPAGGGRPYVVEDERNCAGGVVSKLKASEQRAAPLKWWYKDERFHSRLTKLLLNGAREMALGKVYQIQ